MADGGPTTVGATVDVNIADAMDMERQSSTGAGHMMKRVRSIFKEDEPEWECCHIKIKKKTAVETFGKFFLFLGMMGYIIYQMWKYFDTSQNRKEYVDLTEVTTTPLAYIYVDFLLDNSTNGSICGGSFSYYNDTTGNYSYYDELAYYDFDWTISQLFDYVDDDNDCQSTYITSKLVGFTQVLFIPSSCDKIAVDSKDYVDFYLVCYEGHDIVSSVFWTIGGNREELRNYDTLYDALVTFFWTADWSETGYQVMSSYDWYSFDNQVDDDEYYDYYDMSIEGTYVAEDADYHVTWLQYAPNEIGIKTTFIVEAAIDLLDIFGLAGGMYSTMEQILTYFTVALIWGFSFGCCSISGVASEAGPDGLVRQQLEGFLKARDETIIELTQKIVELEEKFEEFEKEHGNSDQRKHDSPRLGFTAKGSTRTAEIYKQSTGRTPQSKTLKSISATNQTGYEPPAPLSLDSTKQESNKNESQQ